jgi:signal transduction histidine kinase
MEIMHDRLKDWLLKDYRVPKSEGVQFITILILTILTGLIALGEYAVDLKATTLPLILSLLVVNVILLVLAKKGVNTRVIGNMQLGVLYLMFQVSFFLLPGVFHVFIYWMVSIPLLAFIFGNLRTSHIWLVVVLITICGNTIYGIKTMGGSYEASIPYLPYAFAGTIFTITLVACFSLLYNLLGKAYSRLRSKNREVIELISQLKAMNGSLERVVRERTKDIEERNKKLKKYAFMNSHMVRAPLANILGAIQHLEDKTDQIAAEELLDIVKVSATSLDDVIKEIGRSLDEQERT